jgi:hypothetical protein
MLEEEQEDSDAVHGFQHAGRCVEARETITPLDGAQSNGRVSRMQLIVLLA